MKLDKEKKVNLYIIFGSVICVWVFIFFANFLKININNLNTSEQASIQAFQTAQHSDYATRRVENYTPLVNDHLLGDTQDRGVGFGGLLVSLYRWGLSLAVILSIIVIIFGGIQYMTTDSISGKSNGKDRIKSALLGLILALGSYLILYTINPQLVSLEITTNPGQAPSAN